MIHNWSISNFKAVSGKSKVTLDLRELNILVGPNSSGKSTLLQSILMVAQTLRNSTAERPIILNGDLVKLGKAAEVVHEGCENYPLKFSFSYDPFESEIININQITQRIDISIEFTLPKKGVLGFDLTRLEISKGENIGIIAEGNPNANPCLDLLEDYTFYVDPILRNQMEKGYFIYSPIRLISGHAPIENIFGNPAGFRPLISVFHFLPLSILEIYDRDFEFQLMIIRHVASNLGKENKKFNYDLQSISLRDKNGRIAIDLIKEAIKRTIDNYDKAPSIKKVYSRQDFSDPNTSQILQSIIIDMSKCNNLEDVVKIINQKLSPTTIKRIVHNLNIIGASIETRTYQKDNIYSHGSLGLRTKPVTLDLDFIRQQTTSYFTERLRYLGPLRDDPRSIYGMPQNPETKDVGMKGEYTAAVLERHKNDVVYFPIPPNNGIPLGKTKQTTLIEAIGEWLRYLDMVENVTTNDLGKIGYELKVKSYGVKKELDLTDVGVGVSQVLPTLVTAILSSKDSLILLEQPELHLHPKVQSRLGDFLLCLGLSGKQCIVETHSEYLVNRIRRRIAEGEGRSILDKTSIFFVEKNEEGAKFSRIEPNEYGAILTWPKGFFDEGPAEAELIMSAAIKKRKENKSIRN